MLLRLVWALTLSTTAVVGQGLIPMRHLEEDSGDGNKDFSSLYAKYSNCFRVKIQQDNDDQVEGNSYFYNGKYYAQYETYAAFHLCSGNTCGSDSCERSTGYVTDLKTYLESNVEFVQDYCNACSNQCRRRLEDEEEEEEEEMYVDCSTCGNQCSRFTGSDDGYDEADYLDCQAGYNDGETQYYQAPSCDSQGNIVIGMFYDEDCTVKSNTAMQIEFDYETFLTVESMCAPCNGNDEICEELYDDATHCYGSSVAQGGDGGNTICKKYNDAIRERTYAKRKSKRNIFPVFIGVTVLSFMFCFLSHTYFIRHRNKANEKSIPLSRFDHGTSQIPSELPAVS